MRTGLRGNAARPRRRHRACAPDRQTGNPGVGCGRVDSRRKAAIMSQGGDRPAEYSWQSVEKAMHGFFDVTN
jgi:hypothetical protein